MTRILAALVAGALGCTLAAAQDSPRWYLQVDNDVVFGTDRWYTSGVRLARVVPWAGREVELALQQDIWTPEAKGFHPGMVDRVPAARLYGALATHDRDDRRHVTLEGTLGVRGPAAQGERATEFIHRAIPSRFVDWTREDQDNHLEAQATYSRSDALGDFVVHHGLVAGTMTTFAHAGAEWRYGGAAVGAPSSVLMRFAPTPPWGRTRSLGWSGYVGASVRYVATNRILRETYDLRTPRTSQPGLERGIARAAAGVTWMQDWGHVVFGVALDTREFEQQRRPHRFGSLTLHVPF